MSTLVLWQIPLLGLYPALSVDLHTYVAALGMSQRRLFLSLLETKPHSHAAISSLQVCPVLGYFEAKHRKLLS